MVWHSSQPTATALAQVGGGSENRAFDVVPFEIARLLADTRGTFR